MTFNPDEDIFRRSVSSKVNSRSNRSEAWFNIAQTPSMLLLDRARLR